jgi:arabinogalactan endo-1,4-beta-galactosidase
MFKFSRSKSFAILACLFFSASISSQKFYTGADLSYVNEMEDCGVVYKVGMEPRDPYSVFMEYGCNLVRLRLWHTPSWYDTLNNRERYSDLKDVKRSITRAKLYNMEVLLDFHLSDNWADPAKQLVPAAWEAKVNDPQTLADSVYQYIFQTLMDLDRNNLLPEFVQVGNETNKGILLSEEENRRWTLDWERNAMLFNSGIRAVRDASRKAGKEIKIIVHVASPDNTAWMIDGFLSHGVVDFDIIGISYYWAWHKPTEIEDAAAIVGELKASYPDKEVMIVETGYIWTNAWHDKAANIITEVHPDYSPASPENQRDWLVDMTKAVKEKGCMGVLYWEPAWVSSDCYTQWGLGSHQEHAAFFDFNNNLIIPGGVEWMEKDYEEVRFDQAKLRHIDFRILKNAFSGDVRFIRNTNQEASLKVVLSNDAGDILKEGDWDTKRLEWNLKEFGFNAYMLSIIDRKGKILKKDSFHYFGK